MSKADEISEIYSDMFDAARGVSTFELVLDKVTTHFSGVGSAVFEHNRKTGEILDWLSPGLTTGDYPDRLHAINPRMQYSLVRPAGHVVHEQLFISEAGMNKSEFYDGIGRLSDVRYFMGSRLYDDGDISAFTSIEFSPSHGPAQDDDVQTFARLSKNLGHARRLAKTQTGKVNEASDQLAFDHLPWAAFLINDKGLVVPQNEAARSFFVTDNALSLVEGILKTPTGVVNERIDRLFKQAIAGTPGAMLVPVPGQLVPLTLQVFSLPGARGAILFVRDPHQSFDFLDQILPTLFGLTSAEMDIVKSIAQGNDMQAVAEDLGRSRNTVRNHLQNIYHKTGAKNRSELLVQILGLLG